MPIEGCALDTGPRHRYVVRRGVGIILSRVEYVDDMVPRENCAAVTDAQIKLSKEECV